MKKNRREIINPKFFSPNRIESFSDAFIAIIITLMVLEIPLPKNMELTEILVFGKSILIYFSSFIIVGNQWYRHQIIFSDINRIPQTFIWKNMLYLFTLSLIPVLMKWLLEYPTNLIPAIAYSAIYIVTELEIRWLFWFQIKTSGTELPKNEAHDISSSKITLMFSFFIFIFVLILIASLFYPEVSIICFIVFPVIMSLRNIFTESNF